MWLTPAVPWQNGVEWQPRSLRVAAGYERQQHLLAADIEGAKAFV